MRRNGSAFSGSTECVDRTRICLRMVPACEYPPLVQQITHHIRLLTPRQLRIHHIRLSTARVSACAGRCHVSQTRHLQESLHHLLHHPQVHDLKNLTQRERDNLPAQWQVSTVKVAFPHSSVPFAVRSAPTGMTGSPSGIDVPQFLSRLGIGGVGWTTSLLRPATIFELLFFITLKPRVE